MVFPPHFEQNETFQRCQQIENDDSSFGAIKQSIDARMRYISKHGMPLYQGPFTKPLGRKLLNQTFEEFTTFRHLAELPSCEVKRTLVWVHISVQVVHDYFDSEPDCRLFKYPVL